MAGFGVNERRLWEEDPAWQGFRELMEKALIAWDWGEAFAAVNLVAKPAIEETLLGTLGAAARAEGDTVYGLLSQAQMRDAERHRRWASALVAMALQADSNRDVLLSWLTRWLPLAHTAIDQYCQYLPDGNDAAVAAKDRLAAFHAGLGLGV